MTGRSANSPEPTEKELRQYRFWGWIGLVVLPLILLGAMIQTGPGKNWTIAGRGVDTVTVYVTRAQCNDEIVGNTTLLMEAFLDSASLVEFRRRYPREDSLARIANNRLGRR